MDLPTEVMDLPTEVSPGGDWTPADETAAAVVNG